MKTGAFDQLFASVWWHLVVALLEQKHESVAGYQQWLVWAMTGHQKTPPRQ